MPSRGIPIPSATVDDDDRAPRIRLHNREWRYVQVADDLEARIRAGEWPFDSLLPRRDDIAHEYGVGEVTARRALGVLAERGLVVPRPSVGHVVIWPGHNEGTSLLRSQA